MGNRDYNKSSIEFPYGDLNDAIKVASIIQERYGTECDTDQLSAELGTHPTNGTFRTKLSAARIFGATENRRGYVAITSLGRRLADPHSRRNASVEAFLGVELYGKIFEKFKGEQLPPPKALERVMVNLGVVQKQVPRVRQAFNRSAEQAGFFESAKDRLVKPGSPSEKANVDDSAKQDAPVYGTNLDPLILALIQKIPSASEGWPKETRIRWFRTFAMNVSQVYDDATSTVDLKIEEDLTSL